MPTLANVAVSTPPPPVISIAMRVYIVRHGQTVWNTENRAQGHSDIPLDAEGLAQSECLYHRFRELPVSRLLSSDLQRAVQTATPISRALEVPIETMPELRERSYGIWEGEPFDKVSENLTKAAATQNISRMLVRAPEGESVQELWNRVGVVARIVLACSEDVVVVGHGGSCCALLAHLVEGNVATTRCFRLGNTSVTELQKRREGLMLLVQYNDLSHLSTQAAVEAVHAPTP